MKEENVVAWSFIVIATILIFTMLTVSRCRRESVNLRRHSQNAQNLSTPNITPRNADNDTTSTLIIHPVSLSGDKYDCPYTIRNTNDNQAAYTLEVEIQEGSSDNVFRNYQYLGNVKQGNFAAGEARSRHLYFPSFARNKNNSYRVHMQVMETINNMERFAGDNAVTF